MSQAEDDAPNRWPWPPMLYAGSIAAAILLERAVLATSHGGGVALAVLGGLATAAGLTLELGTAWTIRRAKTTIMPHRAASKLVTWGPFRVSRNPIYLGNTLLLVGLGLVFDNLWLVGFAFLAAAATQKLAIEREERHLARKFGADWETYTARVRRWL